MPKKNTVKNENHFKHDWESAPRTGVGRGRGRGAILREAVVQTDKFYKPSSVVDNKSGDTLPAVPGQCKVQDSWNNITKAPIAYQLQQMIGDQYSDQTLQMEKKTYNPQVKNKDRYRSHKECPANRMKQNENLFLNHSDPSKIASNVSLDSTTTTISRDSSSTSFTKLSFVGSDSSIPTLADSWVPLDFDSPKMYKSSQF